MIGDERQSLSFVAVKSGQRRRFLGDLRSRVLGAMVLISLVPMSLVAYQGYHCARHAVHQHVHQHLVSVIEARKALLDEWLRERSAEIGRLSTLPGVRERAALLTKQQDQDTSLALTGLLEWAQASSASYESLTAYDLQWKVLAGTSRRTHVDKEFLTDTFKIGMKNADGTFFDVVHPHEAGDIGLHIGHSLRDENGKGTGFIVANLNLSKSLDPLLQERSGLWRTGKVYIVSTDLCVLSDPFPSREASAAREKASPVILECVSEAGPLVREYEDYLGNKVLGTALAIPEHGWFLVAEMDTEEALEWLDKLIFRASGMVTATLILVVFVSLWASGLLGKPLRELARVAHRIREGHVHDRVEPMSGTEAEEVRRAFNLMLDELREKQAEIVRTATLASVGELSTSIVHEMRNPLSSIKMNIQALGKLAHDNEGYGEVAEIASEQVARVESMLTDLLQYGRPLELQKEPLSFEETAKATLDVVSDLARDKQVEIEVADSLGPIPLHIDREQMCRVLSNLLANAIQAAPAGSTVSLAARRKGGQARWVDIEVSDRGPGFTKEAEEHAFTPFFSTKPDGTGLGLANVKKIVELHGGTVSAQNRPEGGAVLLLTLPAGVVV